MQSLIRRPPNALEKPFLVIWEVTQACDLACQHCRASAVKQAHPHALTRADGEKLLRDVAAFGKPYPLIVFTGGDPFKRQDLTDLIRYARSLDLHVGVSPSATPLLTLENLERIQQAGAQTISLSIDGSHAQLHDRFRGVEGSFDYTMAGCRWAQQLGLKLQVNTTIGRHNLHDLVELATLAYRLRLMTWSVFLLVPTGRAHADQSLSAHEIEAVMHFLADVSAWIPLKTTEGHHYKRVVMMRKILQERGLSHDQELNLPPLYHMLRRAWQERVSKMAPRAAARRQPMHINSGQGFVFVSHLGHVFPSGFLPIAAGNVRTQSLVEIYRESPLFQSLRQPSQLKGRCGQCEFKEVCGGSRSRAYAMHGDELGEDPSCAYQPGSFPYPVQLAGLVHSS
ncbi:TIGR04053 family radical SAM/SPASM domain-containing protein [bacterium]|nr:TIGR04053 family radical SAM/SPASM domain-containing protein [bacterium]